MFLKQLLLFIKQIKNRTAICRPGMSAIYCLLRCAFICLFILFVSCYEIETETRVIEDGVSTVIYDLPGDTLASEGWADYYKTGDTYLRQKYYTNPWGDSIRFVPQGNEVINAALGVDSNLEEDISWLPNANSHPSHPVENQAYHNTTDGKNYIFRSNSWYQMDINGEKGTAENDGIFINWRAKHKSPATIFNLQVNDVYVDADNDRLYIYNGLAWELLVNNANRRTNTGIDKDLLKVDYSKSGKETGIYNIFLFNFSDQKKMYIRDAADSLRWLKTDKWDIAFTDMYNSIVWVNNSGYEQNPGYKGNTNHSVIMYEYGYEFMNEAPSDEEFDSVPAEKMRIAVSGSEYGDGINAWFEYSTTTHIANPYPYRGFYIRLDRGRDPNAPEKRLYQYGKLQLISMYKGAPSVVTDLYWPSPYITFRYYINPVIGDRNLKTKQ